MKFVKTSFFSARSFQEVAEVPPKLALWLARRANGKLCQATGMIPARVHEEERAHLRPLKASIFLKERVLERDSRKADGKGLVSVAGSRYSVPAEYRGREVEIYLTEGQLFLFDQDTHQEVGRHALSALPGQTVVQKAHLSLRSRATEALEQQLSGRLALPQWSAFLQANRRRFSRYRREQATELLRLLDEGHDPQVLEKALTLCLEHRTVSAANLRDGLVYFHHVECHDAPDVLSVLSSELGRRKREDPPVAKRKASYYSALLAILGAAV